MNKDGSGGYKIKDHSKKIVDTTKLALTTILDHFNIQVDNPFTILTQDESRRFLSSSTPKDKYTHVLIATRLAQLTEEYERIAKNVDLMQSLLDGKKASIADLKAAYKRAKVRAEAATAVITQYDKLGSIKNELTWAYVTDSEKKVYTAGEAVQKAQIKMDKILQDLYDLKDAQRQAEEKLELYEEALVEQTNETASRDSQVETLAKQLKDLKAQKKKLLSDECEAKNNAEFFQDSIQNYDARMAELLSKAENEIGQGRQAIHSRIASLKKQESKAKLQRQLAVDTILEGDVRRLDLAESYLGLKGELLIGSKRVETLKSQLSTLERAGDENHCLFTATKCPRSWMQSRRNRGSSSP